MKTLPLAFLFCCSAAMAQSPPANGGPQAHSATATYSQKTLLKNWALSVCLARIAKTQDAKDDANAAAAAYMEFGKQQMGAYEALRELVGRYAERTYAGAVPSEWNTMKCIDLLHSQELDALATRLARPAK